MNNRLQILMSDVSGSIGAVMITSDINRRYYTGFASSAGTLIVLRSESYLIIDSRYYHAAKAVVKNCDVILQDKLYVQITEILKKHGVKTLGIEEEQITLTTFEKLKEKLPNADIRANAGISDAINKQRMIKSPDEIACMLEAQKITDETFAYILEHIGIGMTEKEIALEMEFYSRKNGSSKASFPFIIASGENSAVPHAVPGLRKICRGDFIVLDFGCEVDGYASDMTRTVAIGAAGEKQCLVYDTVLKAQLTALDVIGPGIVCKDVDKVARDIIDATEYKGMFGHGLGHSLGLEIHEPPNFSPGCDTVLEPGCVLSVEPGIYIPNEFGVRIEDVIAVTKNGVHNFTSSEKKLIVL